MLTNGACMKQQQQQQHKQQHKAREEGACKANADLAEQVAALKQQLVA
jgi:hypothetical protein